MKEHKMKKRRVVLILSAIIAVLIIFIGSLVIYNRSEAPIIKSIENGTKGINIVWKERKNAKSYILYRKSDNKCEFVFEASPKDTSYCDENVKSGKNYTYLLKAKYVIGESAQAAIDIDYLACPTIKKVSNQTSCVYLEWKKCGGAKEYTVYRKTGKGNYKPVARVADTFYVDEQIKNGVKITYYVSAANENIKSHDSEKKSIVFITAPKISSVTNTEKYVLLKWNRVKDAQGYILYRKSSIGKSRWERIGTVKGQNTVRYRDKKAPAYESCMYTVKAYNPSGVSGYYADGARNVYVKPVSIKSVKYNAGKIHISWSGDKNCSGYCVYRKIGTGKFKPVFSSDSNVTSFAQKTATGNKRCEYAVCACVGSFKSAKAYTGTVSFVNPDKPMLALTFDDGPNGDVTLDIVNTLKKYNARATFFVVGERAEWNSSVDCIKKAYNIGCEIGNHTYGHCNLTYSDTNIDRELSDTSDIVKKITGHGTRLVRPPEGAYNADVRAECGYPMILWSVDTRDWESRNSTAVLRKIKNGAQDGAIILMHDLYPSTAAAVKKAVPWLVKKGYQLVTVSELMQAKGITLKAGEIYFNT
ncbi:MAG: polysaccharide deacetylase family protein [Clostridia bacterium]|nr:polysaccharide deacetylase family protein [Clostridia bacterium]